MARRKKQEKPLTLRQIRNLLPKLGEPCHVWSGGQDEFAKPKKGTVEFTDCQTANCGGKAHHKTTKYPGKLMRWLYEPNSFYCWSCTWKRAVITTCMTTALILASGLALMLLPTVGIGWTLLAVPAGALALFKFLNWGLTTPR